MGKYKSLRKGDAKALTISHPNSRKAKALSKKLIKSSTRQKSKLQHAIKRNLFGEKLLWFHDNLESVEEYTAPMFDQLIQKYLTRFSEELEQIAIKHSIGQRKNRQHASREDVIRMTLKRDVEEYNTSGIEMVNILNKKQLKLFKGWDGEMGFLNQFEVKRFSKSSLANQVSHHAGVSEEYVNEEITAVEGDNRSCQICEKIEETFTTSIEDSQEHANDINLLIDGTCAFS